MDGFEKRVKQFAFRKAVENLWNEHREEKCPSCGGSGSYFMEGDLHKSGGMVPCYYNTKTHYCAHGVWRKRKTET